MKHPSAFNIPTLSNLDWCDSDVVILHACFHLLEDCVENEKLFTSVSWEYDEEHRNAQLEIEALYDWWLERKAADDSDLFSYTGKEQYETDDEMLIRLIKIRRYLWI